MVWVIRILLIVKPAAPSACDPPHTWRATLRKGAALKSQNLPSEPFD
jgi:hypothetical protein